MNIVAVLGYISGIMYIYNMINSIIEYSMMSNIIYYSIVNHMIFTINYYVNNRGNRRIGLYINIMASMIYIVNIMPMIIYLPIVVILLFNKRYSKMMDEYINNIFLSIFLNFGYEIDDRLDYDKNFRYYRKYIEDN
jgi:hypothetical protein